MASLFEQFSTNRKYETEGIIIKAGDSSFRIARAGKSNKRYRKTLESLTKPHKIAIEKETLSTETSEEIMLDVFCQTILLGWENVHFDPRMFPEMQANAFGMGSFDDLAPFSVANAKMLMNALPELYDELSKAANKMSNFRDEDADDAKK